MLDLPIGKAIRTTKHHLELLQKIGVQTVRDLLLYYPRDYEDRSLVQTIATADISKVNVFRGTLLAIKNTLTKNRKQIVEGVFRDSAGTTCRVVWFNQKYLTNVLGPGQAVMFTGRLKYDYGEFVLMAPEYEKITGAELVHSGRIIPVYHETEGLTSEWLRSKIYLLKDFIQEFKEFLPTEILAGEQLSERSVALTEIHFPSSRAAVNAAQRRLAFEELFLLQLKAVQRKKTYQVIGKRAGIPLDVELMRHFTASLPWPLTDDQKIAIFAILKNMAEPFPMRVLLEGDVGSGKTVVAVAVALAAIRAGYQVAILVPTEVLARQHESKIRELLPSDVTVEMLVGSQKASVKKPIIQRLQSGALSLIVGTHALLEDKISFTNLGLVIIDEQHRFGVEQRARLEEYGYPHVLHMTATPIPRSLALTIYGDQDLVLLKSMPAGRKKIITKVVSPTKRNQAYEFVRSEVSKGRQVFVVCPLIEESDTLGVRAATQEVANLRGIYPEFTVDLLHGKMSATDKTEAMERFRRNEINILVSTSVIEVGVDVPNASIMLIEGAERFGLAQLHQFRGRVGRGEHQSYCFLFSETRGENAYQRLKAMEKYDSGFDLAEIDLTLRGPGELFGVRQSGLADLKMASYSDARLIETTRSYAVGIIEKDPSLKLYPVLSSELAKLN